MVGMFASSKAGHDKNHIYIIYKEEKEYVYLVDGISRGTQNPKKKNYKHIQPIQKYVNEDIRIKFSNQLPIQNHEIKREIKLYIQGN